MPDLENGKCSTYLALLRSPLSISVPVVDHLSTSCILDLNSGVADSALGVPFDVVASRLLDEEGLGATLVAVGIDALLNSEVEDLAGCYFIAF